MSKRTWFYSVLQAHQPLMTILPGGLVEAGSLSARPANTPFAQIVEGLTFDAGMKVVEYCTLELWVHDQVGSYTRIDAALDASKSLIEGLHGTMPDDYIAMEYQGRSRDLQDDGYNTITKNDSWRLYARKEEVT